MAVEVFGNLPNTTVTSGGTTAPASGTVETWTVASSSSFPAVSSSATPPTQLHVADIAANSEVVAVTNISGTTWTVTRGAEGTTPVTHAAGFTVYQVVSAGAYAQLFAVDWLNVVTMFGADPTGVADSTTAIQNAINALPATGGVVYLPAGTYEVSSTLTAPPPVRIIGASKDQVTFNFTGSGDCLRVHTTTSLAGYAKAILEGFTIDGTHASAGSAGLHYGDTIQGHLDIAVNNFQGAGSKGVWFDNQYNYTEMTTGRLYVKANTVNVLFDNSANPSGTATNSFDRTVLDIFINQNGVGDGIVFQNGALMFDGRLSLYGNFQDGASQYSALSLVAAPSYSFTATNASPCVFTAAGSYYSNGVPVTLSGGSLPAGFTATTYYVVNASGATFELAATSGGSPINSTSTGSGNVTLFQQSGIYQSVLNAGVELDGGGPGAVVPYTINFGSSAGKTAIAGCTGVLNFGAAGAFASTSNTPGYSSSFQFDGPVFGDSSLWRTTGGMAPFNTGSSLANNGTINPASELYALSPSSSLTGMILAKRPGLIGAPARVMIVNRSTTYSVTFAASGTSNVSTGTSCVIFPGASMLFAWDLFESLWCPAAGVASVTAGDTSIVVGGTSAAPTLETATLDVIAADHPPAANWSNNSHKITSLANGSATADAAAFGQILASQATTGTTGYTLVNGTGNIITWTTPNDGALHRFLIVAGMHVTSTETGGQITASYTLPDGTAATHTMFAAGLTTGDQLLSGVQFMLTVEANTAVTVKQATALTGGAAIMWAEIWGS